MTTIVERDFIAELEELLREASEDESDAVVGIPAWLLETRTDDHYEVQE